MMPVRMGMLLRPGMSAAVSTPTTPGKARAAVASMAASRAWARVLRRMAACTMPGRRISPTYLPMPRKSGTSSLRFTLEPM